MPDRQPITFQPVVLELPGMRDVVVQRDLEYATAEGTPLTYDLYTPPGGGGGGTLVFACGFPDYRGTPMGCRLKEMAGYESWARLAAASGLSAVTYTAADPAANLGALLAKLRPDHPTLGLWACSGNVPTAIGAAIREPLACAILCYGFMFDPPGTTSTAQAAAMFRFANPIANASAADLPASLPLLVVRAGADSPMINATIDHFVAAALARNLPVTAVNHPTGPHSFDLVDPSDASTQIVKQILAFATRHL